jgi:acyl-CoA thioesterase FadM
VDSGYILRVIKPTRSKVLRRTPDRANIGDSAEAVLEGDILDLLASPVAGGKMPLGAGFLPQTMAALGVAASAAYLALGEPARASGRPARAGGPRSGSETKNLAFAWTGGEFELSWRRPARRGEALVGRARLREMQRYTLRVDVETASAASGDVIMTGEIKFLAVRGGRALPLAEELLSFDHARLRLPFPDSLARAARRIARVALSPRRTVRILRTMVSKRAAQPAPQAESIEGDSPRLLLPMESLSMAVGDRVRLSVGVHNPGSARLNLTLDAREPFGFGVLAAPLLPMPFDLASGESSEVPWEITAQRPSEVNLGRPWQLEFILRSGQQECCRVCLPVEVADPEPGCIYYILTNDCETFDGGERTGDYRDNPQWLAMGNRNNFMDPQEYRVQMVEKPEALNLIAEKHGAAWTHFWCTSQRAAAEWAAGQSASGQWQEIIALLDDSIRRGCLRHEYAPHIHFGYEPDSGLPPQPRLLYDQETDGLIPNEFWDPKTNPQHHYHGWDGGRKGISYVKALGTFSEPDSKAGSLFRGCCHVDRLQRGRRQALCARTGAADFGLAPEDQRISTLAYLRNGLLANSDAGYYESVRQYPRGRQAYYCCADDLDREAADLSEAALVEFKVPDVRLESAHLDKLNTWFEKRWQALLARQSAGGGCASGAKAGGLASDSSIAPGVHAIMVHCHAMLMKGGSGRMEDTEGGDFSKLDRHLEYVTTRHPEVRFATMSEVALEFLDYYAPTLIALVDPRTEQVEQEGRMVRFRIRLLGRTIPVSPQQRHLVTVRPPAWMLTEQIDRAFVLRDGQEIAGLPGLQSPRADVPFEVDRRDALYELVLHLRDPISTPSEEGSWPADSQFASFQRPDIAASGQQEVLQIPCPRIVQVSRAHAEPTVGDSASILLPAGLLGLLLNPAAGGEDLLGRGLHPLGTFPIAIAACAAAAASGDPEPFSPSAWEVEHVRGRWRRPIKQDSALLGRAKLIEVQPSRVAAAFETFDEATGQCVMSGAVRLRKRADTGTEERSR